MNKIAGISIFLTLILIGCVTSMTEAPVHIPSATPTIWISSPSPTFFIGDGGVITGYPCKSPCFFGIRIGRTPFGQVISVLEENGISSCIKDDSMEVFCDEKIVIGGDPSTNLVNGVGYYPEHPISLDQIISTYGSPDTIQVIPTSIPEAPKTVILLMFDELRMRIRLPEIDGTEYFVSASIEVELVNYFDYIIYAAMNKNVYAQSWNGYGVYMP